MMSALLYLEQYEIGDLWKPHCFQSDKVQF